ncbi:uncharacterized protein NPIL_229531 [Nephila pilipes]|uniref:Gustatory receptor n=1 Tax=Nephila pilipes TaxID=299642 RepID=A0A8X6UAX1_NEPPI|nr:uncharacterized protein NPIL_229531 [Nephila pilipes]
MKSKTVLPMYNKLIPHSLGAERIKSLNRDEKSTFLKAVRPILLSLMIVGVQTTVYIKPSSLKEKISSLRWWNIIILIYFHLFSLKTFVALILTNGGMGFWMQLTTFLRSSVATISADIYVLKRNKLHCLIQKMNLVFHRFSPEERKCFKSRILRGTFILWVFMAINFVFLVMNVYNMGMEKFLSVHFFSVRISFVSPVTQYAVGCVLLLIRQAIMAGTLAFMIMFYVVLCDVIKCSFRSFNLDMIYTFHDNSPLDEGDVKRLQKYYVYIIDLISRTDDVFSPIVFFWSSAFIMSVCIDITFDISLYNRMDTMSFLASVQKLLLLFLAYISIGLSASLAIEEGRTCLPAFYKVTASFDVTQSCSLTQAMQFFALRLGTTYFSLTGWKFFDLTRGYMITVFGILGSYIIIVFQLNPEAMTAIIKG